MPGISKKAPIRKGTITTKSVPLNPSGVAIPSNRMRTLRPEGVDALVESFKGWDRWGREAPVPETPDVN